MSVRSKALIITFVQSVIRIINPEIDYVPKKMFLAEAWKAELLMIFDH
jgi:hypothetical protein